MPGRALALLFVSTMAWAQCELPDTAAPVRASRAVFDRLVRAADIADRVQLAVAGADCPARQSQFEGAWFEPARRRVSLDAALYEFCAARKDATDCLAFLLGHELGHVSQTINRLSWPNRFSIQEKFVLQPGIFPKPSNILKKRFPCFSS